MLTCASGCRFRTINHCCFLSTGRCFWAQLSEQLQQPALSLHKWKFNKNGEQIIIILGKQKQKRNALGLLLLLCVWIACRYVTAIILSYSTPVIRPSLRHHFLLFWLFFYKWVIHLSSLRACTEFMGFLESLSQQSWRPSPQSRWLEYPTDF